MGCSDPWDEDRDEHERAMKRVDAETLEAAVTRLREWWKTKREGQAITFTVEGRRSTCSFRQVVTIRKTEPARDVGDVVTP